MEFFRWIGGGIWRATANLFERMFKSADAAERRKDANATQWSDLSAVLIGQVKDHGEQIKTLIQQNCDQAADMKGLTRQIEECREHHEECEEDRVRLAAKVAAVSTKVDKIETKLLPEST